MKKTLLALIAGAFVAVGAQANTYTDVNTADVYLYRGLQTSNASYTGTFDLTADGYNPVVETITSAVAEFKFWDGFGDESVTVNMGGDLFSQGSFNGYATIGGGVINAWGILDSTGILSYTVTLTSGRLTDVWLTNASLTAETAARSVPDAGATSILLGLGVLALIGAKRRFASVA